METCIEELTELLELLNINESDKNNNKIICEKCKIINKTVLSVDDCVDSIIQNLSELKLCNEGLTNIEIVDENINQIKVFNKMQNLIYSLLEIKQKNKIVQSFVKSLNYFY